MINTCKLNPCCGNFRDCNPPQQPHSANRNPQPHRGMKMSIKPYPELLTDDERASILREAEQLWSDLQSNDLGGFSGGNRPFYILYAFKFAIEKYGHRDVGLSWSKNDLDAAIAAAIAKETP